MKSSVFCGNSGVFEGAAVWVKNVNLAHNCAGFGVLRDNCAHFGRIECLSPHILAA